MKVEFLLQNLDLTIQEVQIFKEPKTFPFFGKYSGMENNPNFKVTLINSEGNIEREKKAYFHLQSQFIPSAGKNLFDVLYTSLL